MSRSHIDDEFVLCLMNTYMMILPYVSWRHHLSLILLVVTNAAFHPLKFSVIKHLRILLMIVDFDFVCARIK